MDAQMVHLTYRTDRLHAEADARRTVAGGQGIAEDRRRSSIRPALALAVAIIATLLVSAAAVVGAPGASGGSGGAVAIYHR